MANVPLDIEIQRGHHHFQISFGSRRGEKAKTLERSFMLHRPLPHPHLTFPTLTAWRYISLLLHSGVRAAEDAGVTYVPECWFARAVCVRVCLLATPNTLVRCCCLLMLVNTDTPLDSMLCFLLIQCVVIASGILT